MSVSNQFLDCCENGDLENVKLLVTERNKQKGFYLACENGHIEIAKFLHSLGININSYNDVVFVWACRRGHIEMVKWLQTLGVNINSIDDYAFRCVCEDGHIEIAKWLYSLGVNINASNDYAFRWACLNGHIEIVKWLIEINKKPFNIYKVYLQLLENSEHTELIEYLANVYKEDIDYFVTLLDDNLEVITKTIYKKDGFLLVNGIVIKGDENECWKRYEKDTSHIKYISRKSTGLY